LCKKKNLRIFSFEGLLLDNTNPTNRKILR
jgi:hypothetical protein